MLPGTEAYHGENPHARVAAAAREAAARIQADDAYKRALEDKSKADDAVIVGIGICAVLIVNVCYVGYITPPGGSSPPWAECYYTVYVAFLYLNGFAFVFSIAAIVAVLLGPYVAVACRQPYWRRPVIQVGLLHVVISLVTLLGAFACAGFMLAFVGLPPPTCAQLKCSEGGITCNPFYMSYDDKNVSWYDTRYTLLKRHPLHIVLDARLARLNNDTLGELDHGGSIGNEVTCRDYSYMASTTLPGGDRSFFETKFPLLDVFDQRVNRTCYVLLSQAVFESGSTEAEPQESEDHARDKHEGDVLADWSVLRPNPFTLWCSSNEVQLGPGWLPLPMGMAYDLLNRLGHEHQTTPPLMGFTYTAGSASGSGHAEPYCPAFAGFEKFANKSLTRQSDIMAFQFFSDDSNPWKFPDERAIRGWTAAHALPGAPDVENSFSGLGNMFHDVQEKVQTYHTTLGWDGRGAGIVCQEDNGYNFPSCQYHHFKPLSDRRPLSGAFPYAAMRYQCSGADQGVLCDYSPFPPLAVDELGNYLTKRSLSAQSDGILYAIPPTTTWVQWAVVAMLLVALASNVGSIMFLGYPYFKQVGHSLVGRVLKLRLNKRCA